MRWPLSGVRRSSAALAADRLGGGHASVAVLEAPPALDGMGPTLREILEKQAAPEARVHWDAFPAPRPSPAPLASIPLARARVIDADRAAASRSPAVPSPRRLRWWRSACLGASLAFADAALLALRPVGFLFRNLDVIAKATMYLALPLLPSFMALHYVPSLGSAYAPTTWPGAAYLVGLYVSCAFLLMLACFTASFCWRGAVRLMDGFAALGERAFPKH